MKQFFQFIFGHPAILIVLVGSGAGIAKQLRNWAREQRAQRDALQARSRAEAEAMRTGRVDAPQQTARVSPEGERQEAMRRLQQQRAAQLRELQQKRLAELRARRAAESGSPASQPQTQSQTQPQAPARPLSRPEPLAPRAAPRTQPIRRSSPAASRSSHPLARPLSAEPEHTTVGTKRVPIPELIHAVGTPATDIHAPHAASPPAPPPELMTLLGSRDALRRAIIASEVLGPPLALREQEPAW